MTVRSDLLGGLRAAPPAPGRETGQAWAREELARPEYARARPGLLRRALEWLLARLDDASQSTGIGLGRLTALVLVVGVVVLVAVVATRRSVRLRVAEAGARTGLLGASALTAEQHRSRAEEHRAAGRYGDAVREWMRAVARQLDERALLDPRPGRTADELAVEAAQLLPQLAEELRAAAVVFDAVTYGSVRAGPQDAERLRRLDRAVQVARPGLPAGPARVPAAGAPR